MTRALIVIDVQEDYFQGGALPLHEASAVESRIVTAIARARAAGDRVILLRHVSTAKSGLFAADGDGIGIRPAILAAAGAAPVVTKHFADAFQETDLWQHLNGVDTLLVCGMMTQNCVVFTAMSEATQGFNTRVIGELCGAPSEPVHKIALNALSSKRTVCCTDDLWP